MIKRLRAFGFVNQLAIFAVLFVILSLLSDNGDPFDLSWGVALVLTVFVASSAYDGYVSTTKTHWRTMLRTSVAAYAGLAVALISNWIRGKSTFVGFILVFLPFFAACSIGTALAARAVAIARPSRRS